MNDGIRLANLLHQALERVVATDVASAVLFEALGEADMPAAHRGAMLAFVDGPLHAALARAVGARDADDLVELVRATVEHAMSRVAAEDDDIPTRRVPPISSMPCAIVFDDGTGLGRRMRMAFGSEPLLVDVVRDATEMRSTDASMVIVDATTMAASHPVSVAKACASLPPETLRIVHGVETPFGARMVEAFSATAQSVIPVRKDSGAAPIVELIRSRLA